MKPESARTAAVLVLLAACLYLLRGLLPALAWALLLAVGSWPLHQRIVRRLGGHGHGISAALLTSVAVLLLLLPLAWLVWQGLHEAPAVLRLWSASKDSGLPAPAWLGSVPVIGAWALKQWNDWVAQPGALSETVHNVAGRLHLGSGPFLVRRIGHVAMAFFFCVLVLFFLYRDGEVLARQAEAVLLRQFGTPGLRRMHLGVRAARGTVNGLVLVGLGVAAAMSIAYAVADVPQPVVWGLVTGLLGIVPFGAGVALAGVVLFLLAKGAVTTALVLGAAGAVFIFVVDHFVRPVFIAGSSRLPMVAALLGIVAGLETFGVLGIFLGPTLLAVLGAVWRDMAAPVGDAGTITGAAPVVPSAPALETPAASPPV